MSGSEGSIQARGSMTPEERIAYLIEDGGVSPDKLVAELRLSPRAIVEGQGALWRHGLSRETAAKFNSDNPGLPDLIHPDDMVVDNQQED